MRRVTRVEAAHRRQPPGVDDSRGHVILLRAGPYSSVGRCPRWQRLHPCVLPTALTARSVRHRHRWVVAAGVHRLCRGASTPRVDSAPKAFREVANGRQAVPRTCGRPSGVSPGGGVVGPWRRGVELVIDRCQGRQSEDRLDELESRAVLIERGLEVPGLGGEARSPMWGLEVRGRRRPKPAEARGRRSRRSRRK
jgi:hypothetical protein